MNLHPIRPGRYRAVLATLVPALVLAACTSGGREVEVAPIEDIVDGEIEVVADPSGTFATLTVTTSVPVACSVAYGPDGDFGSIATDDDMAGGAHRDHMPRLAGLEPDTTYSYVLQGADADGTLYRSDVMQFTTPSAAAADTPGTNVAGNAAIVDVSSEFSDQFAADNAVDGDLATEWSSDGDGDDASITLDLGAATDIVGTGFRTRTMGDGSATTTSYTVSVDPEDGEEVFGPFDVGDGLSVAEFTTTGQVVRFDVESSTGGNTGAVEVEVYAAN